MGAVGEGAAASEGASAFSGASPRAALAADLGVHVARLLAVGDLEAARVAHEAIGKLIACVLPGNGTAVIDLAARRRERDDGGRSG